MSCKLAVKTVVLPGRQLTTRDKLHDWLNKALEFPYYGRNLDALWDLLSATIPMPVTLIGRTLRRAKYYSATMPTARDRSFRKRPI